MVLGGLEHNDPTFNSSINSNISEFVKNLKIEIDHGVSKK